MDQKHHWGLAVGGFLMNEDHIDIGNLISFENEVIDNVMEWTVENIFSKIWLAEIWSKPAKGGRHPENKKFEQYKDMSYQVHIFTGVAMSLKVIDYAFEKIKGSMTDDELTFKLKRAIFGYLYHDFNKVTNSDFHMESKSVLENLIKETFPELSKELSLSNDNIYQIVVCTEKGTTANILHNGIVVDPLAFEMNFSRMSDVLSGSFNYEDQREIKNISFGEEVLIPGHKIRKMKFANSNMFAVTDLLKKTFIEIVKTELGGSYLWSDYNTVYYISGTKNLEDINFEDILLQKFSDTVNIVIKTENLITFNDRRVDNSAAGFLKQSEHSINEFLKKEENLKQCIYLEDIKLDSSEKLKAAEKCTELLSNYTNNVFKINYRFIKKREKAYSLRDGLEIKEFTDDQIDLRQRIFSLRYVQLVSDLKTENAIKVRKLIQGSLEEFSEILGPLMGKEKRKSVLVFPILLKNQEIEWKQILKDILQHLNNTHINLNLKSIISRIILYPVFKEMLPEVPMKSLMSIVNGFPATEEAKGNKLYGLNTNGFNNRLPTSKIGFGKVDYDSIFEYNIRRNIMPARKGEETLIYLRFPSAIPHLDISNFIRKVVNAKKNEIIKIQTLNLSLDYLGKSNKVIRVDDSIFITSPIIKSEEDLLRLFYNVLHLAKFTKIHARVSFSNAPILEGQLETIKFDVSSTILNHFSWNVLRLNEIATTQRKIETFNVLGNGSIEKIDFKETSTIMMEYMQNPMSIFSFVHKRLFEERNETKVRGFGKQFLQRVEDIRKLGYETEKRGVKKMKNIEELARIASKIVYPKWKMSGNERTWMLRDTLEAIETSRAKVKGGESRPIEDFLDIIGGVINTKLRGKSEENNNYIPVTEIKNFSNSLIRLIKDDFNGKIPSGAVKSYLINAFEFEYMLTLEKRGEKNE